MPVVKCNTQPFTLDTYLQLRTSQYSAMLHQYLSDSPYVLMLATQWQMISLPLLITYFFCTICFCMSPTG